MMRWLLYAVAGESELEYVLGDLDEEYAEMARARGRRAAARWYAGQVLRSILPLLALRVRSGEATHALMAGLAGAAMPLWLCDRLWSFVYSQIPFEGRRRPRARAARAHARVPVRLRRCRRSVRRKPRAGDRGVGLLGSHDRGRARRRHRRDSVRLRRARAPARASERLERLSEGNEMKWVLRILGGLAGVLVLGMVVLFAMSQRSNAGKMRDENNGGQIMEIHSIVVEDAPPRRVRLDINAAYRFNMWFAKLMEPIIMPSAEKKMLRDLATLKSKVEAPVAAPNALH
jgi:hypothetical protein